MIYVVGILFLLGANAFIIIGYMAHWKSIVSDIIKDEKERVWADAEEQIEARAEERAKEILNSIQYTKRVQLVNESDINWGE